MTTHPVDVAALAHQWDEVQLAVLDNPELAQRAAAIADALAAFRDAAGQRDDRDNLPNLSRY